VLDPSLSLAFHQEDNTLGEHLIVNKLSLLELEMFGALQVVISLIKVLLLNLDLSDLIQSLARKMVVIVSPHNLFKIKDRIA